MQEDAMQSMPIGHEATNMISGIQSQIFSLQSRLMKIGERLHLQEICTPPTIAAVLKCPQLSLQVYWIAYVKLIDMVGWIWISKSCL